MKTNFFTMIGMWLIPCLLIGQSAADHDALKALIGQDSYEQIASMGQDRIDMMAYINRHGYYVSDVQGLKDISAYPNALDIQPRQASAPILSEALLGSGNFDLMGYQLDNVQGRYGYYRIGDSGKLLVILPMEMVMEKFETQKAQ